MTLKGKTPRSLPSDCDSSTPSFSAIKDKYSMGIFFVNLLTDSKSSIAIAMV